MANTIVAAPPPNDVSASAAIERLLGRYMRYVPLLVRPLVVSFAREQLLIPPPTFGKRLRDRGYALEPGDTLEFWAAILWAFGDDE